VLDTKTQVRSRRYLPYVLIVELGIFIIVTFCFYLYMGFI